MELKIELDEMQKGMLDSIKEYFSTEFNHNFDSLESVISFMIFRDYLVCQIKSDKENDKNENKDIV